MLSLLVTLKIHFKPQLSTPPPLFPDDTGQTKITSKILGLNANKVVEKLSYNAIRLKKDCVWSWIIQRLDTVVLRGA